MATYLTSAQWRKLEPDLRRVGISPAEYMRQNDIYVDDRMAAKQGTPQPPSIGALSPSPEQGNMAVYGNDTDETEDTALDTGASDLSARPNVSTLEGILAGQRKSVGDLYDKITENIQQRYRKPDINDLLVAVGTGMMSAPGENDSGGFGGAVQRGLRGIGTYAQSRRAYEQDLNKMLSDVEIDKAKTLAGLEGKYLSSAATALKPRVPKVVGTQVMGNKVVAITQDDAGKISTTAVGDAPNKLTPTRLVSGGQPVFTDSTGKTVFADGTPVTQFDEAPKPYTSGELRMLDNTETAIRTGEETLRSLQDALQLSGQAYEGSLSDWRKTFGQLTGSSDPRYTATEQFDNLQLTAAIQNLRNTFGSQITDSERQALIDLQGVSKYPRDVRDGIIRRGMAVVNRLIGWNTKRRDAIISGDYSSRGGSRAGSGNVIRYDKSGKRIK